jgi:hypothetical protein
MRATRVDDSSSGDGLPSHRHIDTSVEGWSFLTPRPASQSRRYRRDTLTCTLSSCTTFDNESGSRHASPRCDTLYDQRVLLRSSRSASESRLPRHLWHCSCLYAVPRARTKWLCAGAEVELSTEAIRKEVMKSLTSIRWHRILRAHHQWTAFQSIRYTLWLMR